MEYQLKTTSVFENWLKKLKDINVKIRILARLDRVSHGNFGDVKTSIVQYQNSVFSLALVTVFITQSKMKTPSYYY